MEKRELIRKVKGMTDLSAEEKSYLIELINNKKKYGLVWEDKPEDVEEQLRSMLPILIEDKKKAIISDDKDAPNHILIEGDNLHALTALSFTHKGKIDVIYIDPPYNTGAKDDFIYNDKYVDAEDSYRHSKWLSFMAKRLKIAKILMSEEGVIFCSIGDNEVAQLILLFNELIGEENQLGIISRVAKTAGDKGRFFAPSKDYILAYAKNKELVNDFKGEVDSSLFKKEEIAGPLKGEKYRDDVAFYQASLDPLRGCVNQRYFVEAPDGSLLIPPGDIFPKEHKDGEKIVPKSKKDKVWRWSVDTYKKKKDILVFKKTKTSPLLNECGLKAKWNIYTKSYLKDRIDKGSSPRDFLDQYINRKGADYIKQYDIDFNYSKPYELIEHLIKITNKKSNITVMDFFAGSGSTLEAVLNLNQTKYYGGTRQCILITNNENQIAEKVTYKRCLRILKPYKNSKGIFMPNYVKPNHLRYYKADFVPSEQTEQNRRRLTKYSTELICIKEDCYTEITEQYQSELIQPSLVRIFTNNLGKHLILIYHSHFQYEVIEELIGLIPQLDSKERVKIYSFSPEKETIEEEFRAISDQIDAVALPDSIYNAYKQCFRTIELHKNQPIVSPQSTEE